MTTSSPYLRFKSPFFTSLKCIALIVITSCSQYEVTLNEKTMYDPTEFRRSVNLADKALDNCVKSALREGAVSRATQLRQLQCGPGQIQSLAGLEIFSELESLGLSQNQITDLAPLTQLPQLRQLNLAANSIIDASRLKKLKHLSYLNLEANLNLSCNSLNWSNANTKLELHSPKHCKLDE